MPKAKKGKGTNNPPEITTTDERDGKKTNPVAPEALKRAEQSDVVGDGYDPNRDRGKLVKVVCNILDGQNGHPLAKTSTADDVNQNLDAIKAAFKQFMTASGNERQERFDITDRFDDEAKNEWRNRVYEGRVGIFALDKQIDQMLKAAGLPLKTKISGDQLKQAVEESQARRAKITELENLRPDTDDPMSCQSELHVGDNPPLQPMTRNIINRTKLVVVIHNEGSKKGKPRVKGNFALLKFPVDPKCPEGATELRKVFHCPVCAAKLDDAAAANGIAITWLASIPAEKTANYENHRDEFEAKKALKDAREAVDERAERHALGAYGKPMGSHPRVVTHGRSANRGGGRL